MRSRLLYLRVKLRYLDEWNTSRSAIASKYLDQLADIPGLGLPQVISDAETAWHVFVVDVKDRDGVQAHLKDHGIETLIHYPVPPHLSEAYASDCVWGSYPITEKAAMTHLSLPIGPHLDSHAVDRVTEALRNALGSA